MLPIDDTISHFFRSLHCIEMMLAHFTYNNHLIKKKALNVLVAMRHVRMVEDFKANSACKSIVVIRHSNALLGERRMACHRVCAKRLAALLLPCFIAAWCSPPLITCTRMLEASKWRGRENIISCSCCWLDSCQIKT